MPDKLKNIMTIRPGKKFAGLIELLEQEAEKHNWSLNKFVLISLEKIISSNEQNARSIDGGPVNSESPSI